MTNLRIALFRRHSLCLLAISGFAAAPVGVAAAAAKAKNPASKLYVADVKGEAIIDTGEAIEDLAKRSVYTAQGTIIETKKPEKEGQDDKYESTMVYSNGTGAYFDADTRVELRQFVQEPFTPTRSDLNTEPSISQTQAFVARGTVGLCNSKLVAGTNMVYSTPQGSVSIRGQKLVIEARGDVTKISMLEGDSTVRGGERDLGGHTIKAGEQAIIRKGASGQANQIEIQPIPQQEKSELDSKVTIACNAKRTVYFDVRENRPTENLNSNAGPDDAGGNSSGSNSDENVPNPNSPVNAFTPGTDTTGTTVREIVPIPVVPVQLPVEVVVSPASLPPPANPGGG